MLSERAILIITRILPPNVTSHVWHAIRSHCLKLLDSQFEGRRVSIMCAFLIPAVIGVAAFSMMSGGGEQYNTGCAGQCQPACSATASPYYASQNYGYQNQGYYQ